MSPREEEGGRRTRSTDISASAGLDILHVPSGYQNPGSSLGREGERELARGRERRRQRERERARGKEKERVKGSETMLARNKRHIPKWVVLIGDATAVKL